MIFSSHMSVLMMQIFCRLVKIFVQICFSHVVSFPGRIFCSIFSHVVWVFVQFFLALVANLWCKIKKKNYKSSNHLPVCVLVKSCVNLKLKNVIAWLKIVWYNQVLIAEFLTTYFFMFFIISHAFSAGNCTFIAKSCMR